jgi:hypothetical protein
MLLVSMSVKATLKMLVKLTSVRKIFFVTKIGWEIERSPNCANTCSRASISNVQHGVIVLDFGGRACVVQSKVSVEPFHP